MTWTPDSPPPCPLCGTRLAERTEPDGGEEGGMLYAYLCPACRWEDAGSYDYQRLTVATAPWTRDLWAELVLAREERDSARRDLARIVQLCGWDCDGNDPESPTGAIHLYGDGLQAVRELRQEHAEDLAQVEAERDTLAARVRELEAEGAVLSGALSAWGRWCHSEDGMGGPLFDAAVEAMPADCFPASEED